MRLRKTLEEKKASASARSRAWYLANRERQLKKGAEYRAANKEKVQEAIKRCFERYGPENIKERARQYYLDNCEKIKLRSREYAKKNSASEEVKLKKSIYGRKWRELNPAKHCAKSNKRGAATLNRRPFWLSSIDECRIHEFYEVAKARTVQAGIPQHVDHIIPLQGKSVSGLHIPENLQVITASENLRKNSFWLGG